MDKEENSRTAHDLGDIIRRWGPEYSRTHPVPTHKRRVLRDLAECRTAALGGHLEQCSLCGYEKPAYNSCGNRHCPVCQGKLARKWLEERKQEVLNTPYFHCVFTIPDAFNVLIPRNERRMYNILFKAVSETLRHFGRQKLNGELGILATLHTWGQTLWLHPHIHCIVTGGALTFDRSRWVSTEPQFLFDVHELSADFRRRFCRLLRKTQLYVSEEAGCIEQLVTEQEKRDWVVYCKKPEKGPAQILEYISRYTHRVALANRRIIEVTEDGMVSLQYKDYRQTDYRGQPRSTSLQLSATELIGRFLQHVLPPGFRKIRCYGIFAGSQKELKLAAARALLGPVCDSDEPVCPKESAEPEPDQHACPFCGKGRMLALGIILPQRAPPVVLPWQPQRKTQAA